MTDHNVTTAPPVGKTERARIEAARLQAEADAAAEQTAQAARHDKRHRAPTTTADEE